MSDDYNLFHFCQASGFARAGNGVVPLKVANPGVMWKRLTRNYT